MKKKWIILGSIIIGISLLATILYFCLKPAQNNILSISGADVLEKIKNKETFILIRTQDGCHYCEEYKPILNRVLTENNIYAYELNTTNLAKEDQNISNEIEKLFHISGTPTTIFITNGKEQTTINRLVGSSSYSNLLEILKERGFIN
ncbi:MAG: thioredoxin family protein [Bacilli bacterium]|nr:thioredoxin family protein [Bacilli bacterium]